jgi:hypothetical protein
MDVRVGAMADPRAYARLPGRGRVGAADAIRWNLGELLGWVPDGTGGHRGQMAVVVKPNGLLATACMAAIAPFRQLIVYPVMLRDLERAWRVRRS